MSSAATLVTFSVNVLSAPKWLNQPFARPLVSRLTSLFVNLPLLSASHSPHSRFIKSSLWLLTLLLRILLLMIQIHCSLPCLMRTIYTTLAQIFSNSPAT